MEAKQLTRRALGTGLAAPLILGALVLGPASASP
jgi:hypothetical protein